jgi:hypothetical protein
MAAINAAIADAEARQAAQGVPGADLAAQRAAIIIAENNAPALLAAEKALKAAEELLRVEVQAAADEIAAQDAAQDAAALNLEVPEGMTPDAVETAQDAQIIEQGEVDTDTVSDPEGMQ